MRILTHLPSIYIHIFTEREREPSIYGGLPGQGSPRIYMYIYVYTYSPTLHIHTYIYREREKREGEIIYPPYTYIYIQRVREKRGRDNIDDNIWRFSILTHSSSTYIHTYIHTYIRIYIHTYIHNIYIHTYIHTHDRYNIDNNI
jgi:hypothetical protein